MCSVFSISSRLSLKWLRKRNDMYKRRDHWLDGGCGSWKSPVIDHLRDKLGHQTRPRAVT